MINLLNYRLKIDLANFYNDQRKLSYIYVDTDKITYVSGLHKKISDVFNIDRPFHLFTDENIFLPLNEDIRIIDKNDTIIVLPESSNLIGIINQPASEKFQAQKDFTKLKEFESTESKTNPSSQSESTSDTDNETKINVTEQLKANNNHTKCEEFVDSANPPKRKRKRGRRRRKNPTQTAETTFPLVNENSNNTRNQSVNNHCNNGYKNTSTPKHLKFNWEDIENRNEKINGNSPKHLHETKPTVRSNESADLTLLLGLKNSKSPLRFVSKKVKPNSPTSLETTNKNPEKNENKKTKKLDSPITNGVVPDKENVNYANINPLDYPAYSSEFEVDDVLAFRTLKMAEDYSPTVSGYIIAKTVSKDCTQNNYVFKILEGHDQMKTPNGKFSLLNDEQNDDNDTNLDEDALVTLNATHLVEPRLIYRVKAN
ncbi:coilin [Chelonus insularis]|uniref:coilin n=1 Tax=Chelonus insularis TaxID=460826 RepID=UPI00158F288A|nr:coilin [Chelonus insularis]XP_034938055.1 coilin [Chelonus insularis]XP_034938056.1 coilin [Chelonus insularis]XP_034938057.1 coilin [Chelonus insularis]XP_034938058.1 coilin [Chelonus insularis]